MNDSCQCPRWPLEHWLSSCFLTNNEIISDTDNIAANVLSFGLVCLNINPIFFFTEHFLLKTVSIHFKVIKARIAVVDLENRMIRQESLPTILGSFNCLGKENRQIFKRNYNIFKIIDCHSIQDEKARRSLKFKFVQHSEYNFSVHETASLDWTKMEYMQFAVIITLITLRIEQRRWLSDKVPVL